MRVPRLKRVHYLGYVVWFPMLDLNQIFKERDTEDDDHNHCVYIWKLGNKCFYIGEGRWDEKDWQNGRPFHLNSKDVLESVVDEKWECVVLAMGLTKKEAVTFESELLKIVKRPLMQRGSHEWDGKSLINKQREFTYKGVSFDVLTNKYLNLDGNNCWKAIRREINGNKG